MPESLERKKESPSQLLDCEGAAFGESIALEVGENGELTPKAREVIGAMRTAVQVLLGSPEEADKQVVGRINGEFLKNDQGLFNQVLTGRMELGEHNVLDWLAGSDDATIAKLALWNVQRNRDMAAQLKKDYPTLVETTLQKTTDMIQLDFFPVDAHRRMYLATRHYGPLKAMDSFERAAKHVHAYFNTEFISMSNLYENRETYEGITQKLLKTTFHEFMHASGRISVGGFMFNILSMIYGRVWEEAAISHATEVAFADFVEPQLDVYDSSKRIGDTSGYSEERVLMGLVSSPHVANIPPDLWMAAFFSYKNDKHRAIVYTRLKEALAKITQQPEAYEDFNDAYETSWNFGTPEERIQIVRSLSDKVRGIHGEKISADEKPYQPVDVVTRAIKEAAAKIAQRSK